MKSMRNRWTLATAIGFGSAFASFPLGERISRAFAPASIADIRFDQLPEHLRADSLPSWLDASTYETLYQFGLIGHIPALLLFGAILGAAQFVVLRRSLPRAWIWILCTAIGFAAILVLEAVERHIVIGPTAGPVEPIMIVFGGGTLAGLLQWWYLHSHGGAGWRYPASWMLGLALGVVVAVPVMIGIGTLFADPLRALQATAPHVVWGIEIVIFGLMFGAVAGLTSSLGLGDVLERTREPETGFTV